MKKLKLILTSAAIVTGTIAAFALREDPTDCTTLPQYYQDGANYKPLGAPAATNQRATSGDSCSTTPCKKISPEKNPQQSKNK